MPGDLREPMEIGDSISDEYLADDMIDDALSGDWFDELKDELSLGLDTRDVCAAQTQLRSLPGTCRAQSSQITLKQAFQMLLNAEQGVFEPDVPTRKSASPIVPSVTCFYVEPASGGARKKRKSSINTDPIEEEDEASISVKYQSFYNSEVYWSANHDYLEGVCAREMSKRCRKLTSSGGSIHGYSGRWFTLLRRSGEERDSETSRLVRSHVVKTHSLVQFMKSHKSDPKCADTASISSDQVSTSTEGQMSISGSKVVKGNMKILGDLEVQGDLVMENLHVKGDLLVEGSMSGQLVTPPGAADYAEWFMFLDPTENIRPGMVVQLRSPEQKITLNTSGPGPLMVVSTTPSVAAGVPSGTRAASGALCAFIGQVPVKIKGPISCGDFIFASQDNDGFGVSGSYKEHVNHDPLGTAMAASTSKEGTVLAFVRWQHNLKWQILTSNINTAQKAIDNMWLSTMIPQVFTHLICISFLYPRKDYPFNVDRILYLLSAMCGLFALMHFPWYNEYINRGDFIVFCTIDILWGIWACTHLSRAMMGGEDDFGPITVYAFTVMVCGMVSCYQTAQLYRGIKGVQSAGVQPCENT